mmetsp:Transcript_51987/g.160171  ORF Transcript_51987/g.160171 Transcript_51987/m.160171 type:complete len:394 (-) Transcript_51987:1461-2642(-)
MMRASRSSGVSSTRRPHRPQHQRRRTVVILAHGPQPTSCSCSSTSGAAPASASVCVRPSASRRPTRAMRAPICWAESKRVTTLSSLRHGPTSAATVRYARMPLSSASGESPGSTCSSSAMEDHAWSNGCTFSSSCISGSRWYGSSSSSCSSRSRSTGMLMAAGARSRASSARTTWPLSSSIISSMSSSSWPSSARLSCCGACRAGSGSPPASRAVTRRRAKSTFSGLRKRSSAGMCVTAAVGMWRIDRYAGTAFASSAPSGASSTSAKSSRVACCSAAWKLRDSMRITGAASSPPSPTGLRSLLSLWASEPRRRGCRSGVPPKAAASRAASSSSAASFSRRRRTTAASSMRRNATTHSVKKDDAASELVLFMRSLRRSLLPARRSSAVLAMSA